jgi:Domain of unknown function (DUF4185)
VSSKPKHLRVIANQRRRAAWIALCITLTAGACARDAASLPSARPVVTKTSPRGGAAGSASAGTHAGSQTDAGRHAPTETSASAGSNAPRSAGTGGSSAQGHTDAATPDAGQAPAHVEPDDDAGSQQLQAPAPLVRKLYTEWLGQLTGRLPNPLTQLGMTGTDLGASFQLGSDLVFLFGDSLGADQADLTLDSLAKTPLAPTPSAPPQLSWYTRPGGKFLPLVVGAIDLHGMNVPVEGLTLADKTYLFFTSGWSDATQAHTTSVLAHTQGDAFGTWTLDHAAASDKFLNVSIVRDGAQLWIWGSGAYRRSSVYLARATPETLAERSAWTYWDGARAGAPHFSAAEQDAQPVVQEDCVGELSVRRHAALGVYMMTYNCGGPPRGIVLRTAADPAGPWSAPILVYEPDDGYQQYMHAKVSAVGHDDGLSDNGSEETWGGEYGPYLIPAWFSEPAPGLHAIVYTLSSWNPYQVQLLQTVLAEPGADGAAPTPGAGLPPASLQNPNFEQGSLSGWTATGDSFRTYQEADGAWALTTYSDLQDAAMGELAQTFTVDALTSSLSFELHGGHGTVSLYDGAALVRRSHARDSNDERVQVVWRLETLRGKTLRLVIEDHVSDPWGFISVSAFVLGS